MTAPSISTVAFDGYAIETALDELARLRIRRVEPAYIRGYLDFDESAFSDAAADRLASLLAERGLIAQAVSAHIDLAAADAVAALARRIGFAAWIGATILITNTGPAAGRRAILRTVTDNLARLQASNVRLALENPGHGGGDAFGHGVEGMALVTDLDAHEVGLNYDFGNAWSYSDGSRAPERDVRIAMPRVIHAHLKDIRVDGSDWTFCELGAGVVNYAAVAALLNHDAPELPLSLELPLRLSRPGRGNPVRLSDRLPLPQISAAIAASVAFWSTAGPTAWSTAKEN